MTIVKRQTNETLRSDIWRACDILRRDNNVGGVVQYTEHLAWLLFLKFLDEEEQERVAQASLSEGEHYEPVLQGELAWDAWAGPAKLGTWKVEDLIQFVRGRRLPGLSTLTGSPLARTVGSCTRTETPAGRGRSWGRAGLDAVITGSSVRCRHSPAKTHPVKRKQMSFGHERHPRYNPGIV